MLRFAALPLITALMLGGCQILPSGDPSNDSGADRARTDQGRPRQVPTSTSDRLCLGNLAANGAQFTQTSNRSDGPGCSYTGAVSLSGLTGDRSRISVTNLGALKCTAASALSGWARYGIDRAARDFLGSGLARIETMGSYSCRNVAGTSRRSGHARAEAIDIGAFVLEDGRRISVLTDWNGGTQAERRFLRRIHESACKRFGTVLGPDYNAAHRNHFHVETGGGGFCR